MHHNDSFQVKHENINSIIIRDSLMAGLTRYIDIWKNNFGNRFINLGISMNLLENVLWHTRDIPFFPSLQNNINKDAPYDIIQGLIAIGFKSSNSNIFICGVLSYILTLLNVI